MPALPHTLSLGSCHTRSIHHITHSTPSSAMTAAKWLRSVIFPLPENPSPVLERFLSSCDRDLTTEITHGVNIILEALFPTKSFGEHSVSGGLKCNPFSSAWAGERKMEAMKIYYRVLEAICVAESKLFARKNLTSLLSEERFQRCLLACSAELVLATDRTVISMLPAILVTTGITAFDLCKIFELFVVYEETLPRELKRHLQSLEEQFLECMAWEKGSSLYNSLVVARPDLAAEINRWGLLAQPLPSLDDIAMRHNIHVGESPDSLLNKQLATTDQNGVARSPKRPCTESRNVLVEHIAQTPRDNGTVMLNGIKANLHPFQATFASPTVPHPTGEKCGFVGIRTFFSKLLRLAASRIRSLCEKLCHPELSTHAYNLFEQILHQHTALFFRRHIDQLILCCLYGVAKVRNLAMTFREIILNYTREPQFKRENFQSVFADFSSSNYNIHNCMVAFYNQEFVPSVKILLPAIVKSGDDEENNTNTEGQAPSTPKAASPFSGLPDMSPVKVSAKHNIYVSPMRQCKMTNLISPSSTSFYACIGESTRPYQSPSKDLEAINDRINQANHPRRSVKRQLNFGMLGVNMVSDAVVVQFLESQNGGSRRGSSDAVAAVFGAAVAPATTDRAELKQEE